jgi:hypothetical protein
MRVRSQAGSASMLVLGALVLSAGAAALVEWRAEHREQNRARARDVVVPAAGPGLSDVHFGWTVSPATDGPRRHVTLVLTAVPAGTALDDGGNALAPDVGPQTPVAGVRVTFSIPTQIPASRSKFAGGATTQTVVTDARGAAEADVVVAPDEPLVVTGTAEFEGEGGRPRPLGATFFQHW